ncbi:MAG TPA: fused MFS/spermidine synthase [Bryobacteraceae bacterium]|nr:fused MFS/spermidine synthase [Bryobacteraceae bacterium]
MPSSRGTARLFLYGATIFLSAFLLFLIQPIFAKLILPWFGGSSAVWTTCLVFFQTALLAGYLYAHLLTRHPRAWMQPWVHIALLAAALMLLPVMPGERWKPSGAGDPAWQILAMLAAVLGLPYFLLSATSPLLQKWLSRDGSEPYRLFALSNVGALLALAAYPLLIEPRISTRAQNLWWSCGFALFAVLCGVAAWFGRPREEVWLETYTESVEPQSGISWLLLAAAGSMMLVSTTNQLTQNVAAVPFLWILPLAVYLLSFIICFESPRWYKRGLFLRLLAVALGSLAYALYDIQVSEAIPVAIPLFTIGLFLTCMFCHGELSRLKPGTAQLTSFYLMIALGGALGAIFTGLIAPHIFAGIYEFPLSLLFVAALALWLNWLGEIAPDGRSRSPATAIPSRDLRERSSGAWAQRLLWIAVTVAMAVALVEEARGYHQDAIVMTRSFYGSLRVVESIRGGGNTRTLYHGTVQHGAQYLDGSKRAEPTTYFGPDSGAGLALRFCCAGPKRVGIIGLGAGTLAAYGQPGDAFRFYEINPQVIQLARSHFTFLSDSKASISIAQGDARLSLERETGPLYDVFIADAFSGDAIPVHLLTKEAVRLYLAHMKPEGILAVHVSNQYLDLAPVVAQLAWSEGLYARIVRSPRDDRHLYAQAEWVVMTSNAEFFTRPQISGVAAAIEARPGVRLWTDDYNNLLQVLRF